MEIWKDIKNYEGLYEISSYGRVRAKYRQFVYTMEYFNNSIGTACPRCKAR